MSNLTVLLKLPLFLVTCNLHLRPKSCRVPEIIITWCLKAQTIFFSVGVCGGRGQEEFELISPILNPGTLFHSKATVYSRALANPFIQGFLQSLRLPIQPGSASHNFLNTVKSNAFQTCSIISKWKNRFFFPHQFGTWDLGCLSFFFLYTVYRLHSWKHCKVLSC